MSSEKLRSDLLLTRDRRQELLGRHLTAGYPAVLFLSLNIAGEDKHRPGTERLFTWALKRLAELFPDLETLESGCDLLGPYAVRGVRQAAGEVKQLCIDLELSQPAGRLVDLDVYDSYGRQIDRAFLSLPPRPCLMCERPAPECMRVGRHSFIDLMDKTDELLTPFRD